MTTSSADHSTTTPAGGQDGDRLFAAVEADLGLDASRWFTPDGYDSVALAVLDSIYSTGNHYTSVVNALNSYRTARRDDGAAPEQDTAADLVAATDRGGGIDGLVERTNRNRCWARSTAPFKAEAAYQAAKLLAEHGLNTRADVQAALTDPAAGERIPENAEDPASAKVSDDAEVGRTDTPLPSLGGSGQGSYSCTHRASYISWP